MCSVCTQPLILPVDQYPLAAFLQHQAPMAIVQVAQLFPERTRFLAFAVILADLELA